MSRPFSEAHAVPSSALPTHGKQDFMHIDDHFELPKKRTQISKSEMDVPSELMEADI